MPGRARGLDTRERRQETPLRLRLRCRQSHARNIRARLLSWRWNAGFQKFSGKVLLADEEARLAANSGRAKASENATWFRCRRAGGRSLEEEGLEGADALSDNSAASALASSLSSTSIARPSRLQQVIATKAPKLKDAGHEARWPRPRPP